MQLSILIISYNTRELTLACLQSVYEQTQIESFEVILVDNASSDGSAEAISRQFPQVRLMALQQNLGFARGNNIAAAEAQGEWLLLLNPDTVILDGAVGRVLSFAREHSEAALFGGRTFFADGSLNYTSCHGRPTPWSMVCLGTGLASLFRRSAWFNPEGLGGWERDTPRIVDAVTGCFLLVRRRHWCELNGFDESFYMYGEETDLCLRARHRGLLAMICPAARLIHHGGKSETVRADKMIRLFRAKAQLVCRHWPPGTAGFGIRMLDLWALTRMLAYACLRVSKPSRQAGFQTWKEVWRRRREYRAAQSHRTRIDSKSAVSVYQHDYDRISD